MQRVSPNVRVTIQETAALFKVGAGFQFELGLSFMVEETKKVNLVSYQVLVNGAPIDAGKAQSVNLVPGMDSQAWRLAITWDHYFPAPPDYSATYQLVLVDDKGRTYTSDPYTIQTTGSMALLRGLMPKVNGGQVDIEVVGYRLWDPSMLYPGDLTMMFDLGPVVCNAELINIISSGRNGVYKFHMRRQDYDNLHAAGKVLGHTEQGPYSFWFPAIP